MKYAAYGSYEPSKSVWFDQLPSHWQQLRVKHVIERMESGVSVNSDASPASNEEIGVLKTSCVYGDQFSPQENKRVLDEQIERVACPVKANRLIISRMNTPELVGSCGYVDHDFPNLYLPDRLWQAVFSKSRKCSPKFAWYYLTSRPAKSAISSLAAGTSASMQNIAQDAFVGIGFPLPPLDEQQTIARFLDAKTAQIDELIAKKRLLIAKVKEKRQALIARTVTRGLPPEAARAAGLEPNPEMKDSGVEWLGVTPNAWQVKRLGFMCSKIGSGKTPSGGAETYEDSGVVFLRSQNVYDEGLELSDVAYINDSVDAEMRNSRVEDFDVLLNITGASIGRSCLVPPGFPAANVNQHVCIIRLSDKSVSEFVAWVLKTPFIKSQIDAAQSGAAREGLNFDQISKFLIALPDKNERKAICKYLGCETLGIDRLISSTDKAITHLTEYRQALITSAVTGKIDVRGLA